MSGGQTAGTATRARERATAEPPARKNRHKEIIRQQYNEYDMENKNQDIDLVYFWVDGNDPAWQAKRNEFICKETDTDEKNS